jgi:hypothetical protein
MAYLLYTTLGTALSESASAPTAGDAMTEMKPEQRADARCSQLYLLQLWREATGAPWRLSLREASAGTMIGFADLDDLVIFLLMQGAYCNEQYNPTSSHNLVARSFPTAHVNAGAPSYSGGRRSPRRSSSAHCP